MDRLWCCCSNDKSPARLSPWGIISSRRFFRFTLQACTATDQPLGWRAWPLGPENGLHNIPSPCHPATASLCHPNNSERTLLNPTVAEHLETWLETRQRRPVRRSGDARTPRPLLRKAFKQDQECTLFAHRFIHRPPTGAWRKRGPLFASLCFSACRCVGKGCASQCRRPWAGHLAPQHPASHRRAGSNWQLRGQAWATKAAVFQSMSTFALMHKTAPDGASFAQAHDRCTRPIRL